MGRRPGEQAGTAAAGAGNIRRLMRRRGLAGPLGNGIWGRALSGIGAHAAPRFLVRELSNALRPLKPFPVWCPGQPEVTALEPVQHRVAQMSVGPVHDGRRAAIAAPVTGVEVTVHDGVGQTALIQQREPAQQPACRSHLPGG